MRRHDRTWHSTVVLLGLALGSLAVCSCSKPAGPVTYRVTGTVTMKGAPVEGAMVVFLPASEDESARASQAISDSEGRFAMRTHLGKDNYKDGMPPGNYGVTVTKLETVPDMRRRPKNLLPRKYSSVQTSHLEAAVQPSDDNDFQFALD